MFRVGRCIALTFHELGDSHHAEVLVHSFDGTDGLAEVGLLKRHLG